MTLRAATTCLLAICSLARAANAGVTRYDLVSKGLTVGHVVTSRSRVDRNGQSCLRCEVTTDVAVNLLFFSYSLHAREVSLTGDGGAVEYTREATEDGVRSETRGRLEGGIFHFEVVRNGATNAVDIATSAYDFTSTDGVEARLLREGDGRTWRILELQDASVSERSYKRLPAGTVKARTNSVDCAVVEFTDPSRSATRWITTDELGMVILRQDGRDLAGSYSMRWSGDP